MQKLDTLNTLDTRDTIDTFEIIYARILSVTNCTTQIELATLLDVSQSSISDAKRRNSIPDAWLIILFDKI